MLLLQERIPKATALFPHTAQLADVRSTAVAAGTPIRVFSSPDTPIPEVQLLSNGRYHVMVTNAGGGYSRWKELAVTRWREDGTRDNWGTFCYMRDVASGAFWSTAYQPTLERPESYEAIFSEGRAEFRRRDAVGAGGGHIETHTEIVVSPEDDIELRRVRITNRSRQRRPSKSPVTPKWCSHPGRGRAAPGLQQSVRADRDHREQRAILCYAPAPLPRRAAALDVPPDGGARCGRRRGLLRDGPHALHRPRTKHSPRPQAMSDPAALSGSDGSVLDPIVAIRCRVTLEPEETATIEWSPASAIPAMRP